MRLAILDVNETSHWMEAHKAGCQHLSRSVTWTIDAETMEAAAGIVAADFIAEGSLTIADAIDAIHWAPCVKLPVRAKVQAPAGKVEAMVYLVVNSNVMAFGPADEIQRAAEWMAGKGYTVREYMAITVADAFLSFIGQ